jgi:hypothetical protein
MKLTVLTLVLLLCAGPAAGFQKKRKAASRGVPGKTAQTTPGPTIVGSAVTVTKKNGDRVTGAVTSLNAATIQIKSGEAQPTISLDTVSSISFGPPAAAAQPVKSAGHPEFSKAADQVLAAFPAIAGAAKGSPDYTEYGRQLGEFRRAAERLVGKYGGTEDLTEARAVALIAGALTDYTWARTIWTLKLGRPGDVLVSQSDSPVVADSLSLYADLRVSAASGEKWVAEKLIIGLWKQAALKSEILRRLRSTASQ